MVSQILTSEIDLFIRMLLIPVSHSGTSNFLPFQQTYQHNDTQGAPRNRMRSPSFAAGDGRETFSSGTNHQSSPLFGQTPISRYRLIIYSRVHFTVYFTRLLKKLLFIVTDNIQLK